MLLGGALGGATYVFLGGATVLLGGAHMAEHIRIHWRSCSAVWRSYSAAWRSILGCLAELQCLAETTHLEEHTWLFGGAHPFGVH